MSEIAARDLRAGDHVWLDRRLRLVHYILVGPDTVTIGHGSGVTIMRADRIVERYTSAGTTAP